MSVRVTLYPFTVSKASTRFWDGKVAVAPLLFPSVNLIGKLFSSKLLLSVPMTIITVSLEAMLLALSVFSSTYAPELMMSRAAFAEASHLALSPSGL